MEPQHINPEDAVKIAIDLNSKNSLSIHHSTFDLTDEDLFEPKRKLNEEILKYNIADKNFKTIPHNDTLCINEI
jgi:N-acyl-phosphatidylethanolamine-hydrolysing phospholipase D